MQPARLDGLYLAHSATAINVARLLCPNPLDAKGAADSAFVRTVGLFRDLGSPLTFETALRRAVIKSCRPRLGGRLNGRPAQAESTADPLWNAYVELPHRKKAALVLRYYERMSDDSVADVLGCSTGAARALINKALAEVEIDAEADSDASRTAGELLRAFSRRTKISSAPVEPDPSVLRRARLRRAATVIGAVVLTSGAAVTTMALVG